MDPIKTLEKEHDDISREIIEFETIMDSEVVNYPNLIHVFKRFCSLWDSHENKEERIFSIMNRKMMTIPIETIKTDHEYLCGHIKNMKEAINSGDDYRVRKCFEDDLKVLIEKIKKHMELEDDILYTVSPDEFSDSEVNEMKEVILRYI